MSKKVLGLIPARGGSKGIPKKNIVNLAGKPLIGWVCQAALGSKEITELIISSDSEEIIEVAKSFGVKAPFIRPQDLAQDNTLVIDVIVHALKWYQQHKNIFYDYVCLLQPTAPLASSVDYDRAIELALEKKADTVISVYKCGQEHPAIMYTREEQGQTDWFVKDLGWKRMARRQDLPPVYMRSGIVYVFSSQLLLEKNSLYGENLFSIEVSKEKSIDINNSLDLKIAEVIMQDYLEKGLIS